MSHPPVIPASAPPACNLAEAAAILGKSRATIRRWLKQGLITGVRLGRDWRIPRVQVVALSEGRNWPPENQPDGPW